MIEEQQLTGLKKRIDLFEYNINQYKGKTYDEAKTRADFIDKFFVLLGWDIYNEEGNAEQYRQVGQIKGQARFRTNSPTMKSKSSKTMWNFNCHEKLSCSFLCFVLSNTFIKKTMWKQK